MKVRYYNLVLTFYFLVVVTSPITAWFAINTYLRLPVIFLVALFLLSVPLFFTKRLILRKSWFSAKDVLLLSWLMSFMISILWNSSDIQNKHLSNFIAFLLIVFGFVFFLKVILLNLNLSKQMIGKFFLSTLFILYLIISVDFVLSNFFEIYLMKIFGWAEVYNSIGYQRIWFSSSSPSEEPGNVAYFINVFWLLTMQSIKLKFRNMVFLLLYHTLCLGILVSTAGFVSFVFALVISAVLKGRWKPFIVFIPFLVGVALVIQLLIASLGAEVSDLIYYEILPRIMLDSDSNVSAGVRSEAWSNAFEDWKQNPIFGNGPGYNRIKYDSSYYGIFSTSLANGGILSFASIALYFLILFFKALKSKNKASYYILALLVVLTIKNSISDSFLLLPTWIALFYCGQIMSQHNE